MFIRQPAFWLDALNTVLPRRQPRIELSVFSSRCSPSGSPAPSVRPWGDRAEFLVRRPDRGHGRGYYSAFALRIAADHGETELGDGRLTTWTAQLMPDAKERCLVSCIATERLSARAEQAP